MIKMLRAFVVSAAQLLPLPDCLTGPVSCGWPWETGFYAQRTSAAQKITSSGAADFLPNQQLYSCCPGKLGPRLCWPFLTTLFSSRLTSVWVLPCSPGGCS